MTVNKWDYFWSESMVWTLRLACYASDYHFFNAARGTLAASGTKPFIFDILIGAYSIFCLLTIEKIMARKYNPRYPKLKLTPEELTYRVGREKIILSGFIFCALNFIIGTILSLVIARGVGQNIFIGLAGLIGSIGAVFLGVVFLVARDVKTNKRMPALYPLGIAAFCFPAGYIVLTLKTVFF